MLTFLHADPLAAYKALWDGAFGSTNAFAETLVKATPLLLVAPGICISFRGDVINIGGEGQMIAGAIATTWVGVTFTNWPGTLLILVAMLAGFLAGAVWGGIPGYLKAYFHVNEILNTVMMNAIAVQVSTGLSRRSSVNCIRSGAFLLPFFSAQLLVGANNMQRAVQVPSALVIGLNGLVVFVVSSEIWRRVRKRRRLASTSTELDPSRLVDSSWNSAEAARLFY